MLQLIMQAFCMCSLIRYVPCEVTGPGEAEESNCSDVMNEHLHKVLPLYIHELGD